MADQQIIRVTLFKIPKKEDRDRFVKFYSEMNRNQEKDGKPYIISSEVGPTELDARNQGFTFASKTVFKNRQDFEFYDKECRAHAKVKEQLKTLNIEAMMMVFWTPVIL